VTKLPYDAVRDFAPVTWVSRETNVVIVHPSLPVKSIRELIALAKTRPGELNFGSSGVGSGSHLALELFKSMAAVGIVGVQYKGSVQGVSAVVSGEVQMAMFDLGVSIPLMKAGRLRGLAVTTATPSALVPELPTVSASGVPGFEAVSFTALWAPAKTPAAIIRRLNQEIVRFLNTPETKQRFLGIRSEVVASSPEQFDAAIKADITRMMKVIKEANIKVE
jgi:tripartite-type tricarboxylate transporter receptor subunit TctC